MTLPDDLSSMTHDEPVAGASISWTQRRPVIAEWVLVVVTLFVLGRSPVLFLRQRMGTRIGGPIGPIWQDDALVSTTFLLSALGVCALAARRCDPRALSKHLLLIALLALAVVSTEWSVEPSITQMRSLMFITTAGVGWYLGCRFTLREQLDAAIGAGAVGVVASLAALVVWPDAARSTNGVMGEWSGVYVNRNLLALVLSTTLLAALLRWSSASGRHRVALAALVVSGTWLLWRSGARTGPVSLVVALVVAALAVLIRTVLVRRRAPMLLSALAMLGATIIGLLVMDSVHGALLDRLGRDPTLSSRTEMWNINRDFIAVRPWRGWGFEAIWTHPPSIEAAAERFGAYPYQAHNGYFEMALSLGRIGLFALIALVILTVTRSVALAWANWSAAALWPLAIATFAAAANFSESLFVANEVLWALFVSAGVAAVAARQDPKVTPVPGASGSPGSPAARLPRFGPR